MSQFFRIKIKQRSLIISRFDVEGEGKIEVSELRFVLKNLPVKLTDGEVEEMLAAVDQRQKGEINIQQFRAMVGLAWNSCRLTAVFIFHKKEVESLMFSSIMTIS